MAALMRRGARTTGARRTRSKQIHPAALLGGDVGRIDHVDAPHRQIDAGSRLSALAERAHEISDLLGKAAKPVLVAARAVPPGLGLELFDEALALEGRGLGRVRFDGVVGRLVRLDDAVGHEGAHPGVETAELHVADDDAGTRPPRSVASARDVDAEGLHRCGALYHGVGTLYPLVRPGDGVYLWAP
jgi:hypothetical protein